MEKKFNLENQINEDSKTDSEKQNELFENLFNQSLITDFNSLPERVPIIYSPIQNDKVIFYRSTVNAITGKGKSRKTSFLIGLLCDAINKNPDLKICWIDTEQAKFDLKYLYERIKLSTNHLNNFAFHSFRAIDINSNDSIDYLEFIIKKQTFDIVILDNITDLDSGSIMDITPAQKIVKGLMKLSENQNITFVCVVHANETKINGRISTTAQGRGHIGSELIRKCHQVVSLTKDNDITTVEFPTSRYLAPDEFSFSVDNNNLPIFNENDSKETVNEFIQSAICRNSLLSNGFSIESKNAINKQTALTAIEKTLKKHNYKVAKRERERYLTLLESLEIISNVGAKNKAAYFMNSNESDLQNEYNPENDKIPF